VTRLRCFRSLILVTVAAVVLCGGAFARPPGGFELRTLARGLDEPTAFARSPDGLIYITQKKGLVRVLDHGALTTFLDLRKEVNEFDERGLVNIAVDPAFTRNRRLFLLYTADLRLDDPDKLHPGRGTLISIRVSRRDPRKPVPGSERTVLTGFDAQGPWHAVAGLTFDARGRLLVGFGDGSPYYPKDFSRAALWTYDLGVLNGKIVRINPESGEGVSDNPFFDPRHPNSVRSKILAYGFRNPFSIHVDPSTGDIWVGDVGTDLWEEVNVIAARSVSRGEQLNYGWPCYEGREGGPAPQPAYRTLPACKRVYDRVSNGTSETIAPRFAYPGGNGAALVLGPEYRGSSYPAKYRNQHFLADWVDDRFWTLEDNKASSFGSSAGWGNPVYIGTAPNGNIRYLAFSAGTLNELVYTGDGGTDGNRRAWLIVAAALGLAILTVVLVFARRRRPDAT
jgi:glucose/arabinose dehydrogenase